MEEYTGEYLELGPNRPSGQWQHYTYIKIGSQIIKNIYVLGSLDVVLRDQIQRQGIVKLWVIKWAFKPLIIGVTQEDGQTFRQGLAKAYMLLAFSLVVAAMTLTVGSFGFVLAPLALLGAFFSCIFIAKIKKLPADHSV
ncbi:hypothetical protein J9978_09385 [Chromobacterium violaceum]|uniref:hypothetical protein n=1 Tax=Chromobacterium violaceum TaxID=536 RepID=UPI001B327D1A|nr:hypothetical protein [Chromobacterium violaceum]MBP4049712.1 hypothetical protein [Chromobacterium violaceum]